MKNQRTKAKARKATGKTARKPLAKRVPVKPVKKTAAKPVQKEVAKAVPKTSPAKVVAQQRAAALRTSPAGRRAASIKASPRSDLFEHEGEPPERPIAMEPPIPTPSRRKPKPGSPDWPGESLTVGMEPPEFSLPSTLGRRVSLSEFRGKRVVLYFYPKDDTPGCTMEACAFRDNMARITAKDAVILGISLDDELSHQRFQQKYNLPFPLLSDVDAAVSRKYGTYKEKSLYGRTFWGIERTTFVIDREGKVENVFRRVKVEGHADEVLATISV